MQGFCNLILVFPYSLFFSPKSSLLICTLSCYHHIIEHLKMHFLTWYKQRCYARISVVRNALTANVNKCHFFFHVRLKSPISCWHVTRFLHDSVRLMNELRSLHNSQSINNYCLYDKKNDTWLLSDIKFLFSCSTLHLTRELSS